MTVVNYCNISLENKTYFVDEISAVAALALTACFSDETSPVAPDAES